MPDTDVPTRAGSGEDCAPDFVYTVYIAAPIERVWSGLIDGELTRAYWGHDNESTWQPGAPWRHVRADESGEVDTRGHVIEFDPPHLMVWSWAFDEEADDPRKVSRVAFELVALGPDTRLTVRHTELEPDSVMDRGVRDGWPAVLSNLKTLLETGRTLSEERWPEAQRIERPD